MKLKVKVLEFFTSLPVCLIHTQTARRLSLHPGHRVAIKGNDGKIISVVDEVNKIIKENEIIVSEDIFYKLKLRKNQYVQVSIAERPKSAEAIKKKLDGHRLTNEEIKVIVGDIAANALTDAEIAFFIAATYAKGMTLLETKYLTDAMAKTSTRLSLSGQVVDKHCIGGIPGNRTTPIVVAICAAAGLQMPKTSSRAITSAAGTADVIETLAKVDFSTEEVKKIVNKTNACLVWGGAFGLAPVDASIIKVERLMTIDSTAQLLASILSKKLAVGSKYILIDIPFGPTSRITTRKRAEELKDKFKALGEQFNLKITVVITDGAQPVGRGVGPILEMRDVLSVLRQEKEIPKDLQEKSLFLAGTLLELTNKVKSGQGYNKAKEILIEGDAFKKYRQIIQAQGGKIKDLPLAKYTVSIRAERNAKGVRYHNKLVNKLARRLGCPEDKEAGLYLVKKKDEKVKKGEVICILYAATKEKLGHGKLFYAANRKEIISYQ